MKTELKRLTALALLVAMAAGCAALAWAWIGHDHTGMLCDGCARIARAARTMSRAPGLLCAFFGCAACMAGRGRIPCFAGWKAVRTPVGMQVRMNQ